MKIAVDPRLVERWYPDAYRIVTTPGGYSESLRLWAWAVLKAERA